MPCAAMRKADFAKMNRSELQKLAKEHGIDPSLSTSDLRRLLEELHEENELSTKRDLVEAVSR